MAEHHVSVMVDAPVHQVYELFTHLNGFQKFKSFVQEVTTTMTRTATGWLSSGKEAEKAIGLL